MWKKKWRKWKRFTLLENYLTAVSRVNPIILSGVSKNEYKTIERSERRNKEKKEEVCWKY